MQSIRREVIVGSLSFVVCSVLLIYYVVQYKGMNQAVLQNSPQASSQSQKTQSANGASFVLSVDEVATHATRDDCWIIINGSVYVVTDYLSLHPGGASQIMPYCGQDASTAFITQGGRGGHSQNAYSDLSKLVIGKLNEKTTFDKVQIQKAAQSIPIRRGEEEEEDE